VQARGIDRNTLDGLFMAWNFYSGMPLQQTSYIALFLLPLTNCQLGKGGNSTHLPNSGRCPLRPRGNTAYRKLEKSCINDRKIDLLVWNGIKISLHPIPSLRGCNNMTEIKSSRNNTTNMN